MKRGASHQHLPPCNRVPALLVGLASAKDARLVVGGTSAGGLATYLHIDHYRERIPPAVRVVGMPDAGFFLDVRDV